MSKTWTAKKAAPLSDTVKARISATLHSVYSTWHGCALRGPLHPEDRKRGLRIGQLCDDCEEMVKAHIKDIFKVKRMSTPNEGLVAWREK